MMTRKERKAFAGTIGSGLPYEIFEAAVDSPDVVLQNLELRRPMIEDIRAMARMPGWTQYIEPFLEKKQNPARLMELIEKGEDAKVEVAQIKAYGSLLNLVRSILRTGVSLDKMASAKAEEEKQDE